MLGEQLHLKTSRTAVLDGRQKPKVFEGCGLGRRSFHQEFCEFLNAIENANAEHSRGLDARGATPP